MTKALVAYSTTLLSSLLLLPAAAGAATVTFTAANEIAQQNGPVTVDIDVSGFTTVSTFQFTLEWDPGVLSFVSEGNFAGLAQFGGGNFGNASASSGRLTVSWDDPNFFTDGGGVSLANGSTLFSVNFTAVGSTGFHSAIDFTDSIATREVTQQGNPSIFNGISGSVDITPVPEPCVAALGLMALGALGLKSSFGSKRRAI
jgi:hypothetical protein